MIWKGGAFIPVKRSSMHDLCMLPGKKSELKKIINRGDGAEAGR